MSDPSAQPRKGLRNIVLVGLAAWGVYCLIWAADAQEAANQPPPTSYAPVVMTQEFDTVMDRMVAAKDEVMARQMALLAERYDLSDSPMAGVTMSGGKAVQGGPRAILPEGVTWEMLAAMTPEQIRLQDLFPHGFRPLPHINHGEGGMVFPDYHIEEVLAQEGRDLTRFDMDYDLPTHFLPDFPPAIYLTTRPDLGDVSQGEVVTIQNYYRLFNGILNPKQLEGVRLLVTPFPQQQFNATDDRRSASPHLGVTCFDCHVNGHTNAATHLVGDIRPQQNRRRLDTPTLRGVNIQRLFGSQRALKTVEDFTEFEQRAAYFDGDHVIAARKGVNILERGSEVHFMAEFEAILDFPPAPKLNVYGKLDPDLATEQELLGQEIFFGKGTCGSCHPAPYYTDNLMHNVRLERFYDAELVNGRLSVGDGPIKTFPLRGIKDSPPYHNDGRLLTLPDTVEFWNLVLETDLTAEEKEALVAFLLQL